MNINKTIESTKEPRISVAPMMDWTTKDYRFFGRLFNPNVVLYTEMVTTGAIIYGGANRHLDFNKEEHPIVLQLGGSNPQELATCTKMAEDWGYNEVNLNVGCPSDRVQNNKIGACLMAEPDLVAECIHSMQKAVSIPVTVKHRIGIDDMQSYEEMLHFVDTVAATGCTHFIVHARIAILQGLSPKENREVPPLRYEDVYRLKQERPHLTIEINGGIKTFEETQLHLQHVDGVMIGREAYHNPYLLAEMGQLWNLEVPNRFDIMQQMMPYIHQRVAEGAPLSIITRHILGLFQNLPGARKWRQALSGGNAKTIADIENAIQNIQAAMQRTEDYIKEHQH
ncbi:MULTISPECIES: tRNA dihydrouridine(20/20a) synthase DusA [unclassified Acinetobacter]|uniref:tRNA dihydrouridine(20/20a) synthase DusA n=1 Tax=unclassified Acinetobacter TaxID=196816 RepID=UPI002448952C|nr:MULTISPECIES: tRNA dihydrouridine(20/20a) synthase DusA [unclassified Acinetobacter]MDH0031539.1 tRNA dihydrouridine(20/20a) synthase DusA [Acinetobacter sp. GD04021]MDH0886882.1 tRNA dihydrouridine(20/20a) synthase DusA [Acinetobacter sp. GD03873]MDH1083305.1 tRNA dihydrouridine(20/20a) synthase DusA [Acinetobacter sp. GD03983]MDH2190198.1 tRNA dihydrouridine(20/20a) synthase DusA [Acinetobacter sp. GD03645]MDH2203323.1 tRNA dihydrouridine(20/20a) synthase DusA [Acinetobacter sp. GD03647]